jgi:hypothetical protein
MAVALILDFPGGTKRQYEQVIERMDLGGRSGPGGLFHAAGSYAGGWRVTDAWEDMEHFARFRDEKIGPLTAEAGMAQPEVRVLEVHERKPGSGAQPALVQFIRLPGLTAETFAAMDSLVLPDGRTPPSITFHVNGPMNDGWYVLDGWASKEARDRFTEEQIRPAVEGAPLSGPPVIEDLVVEGTLAENPARTRV